MERNVDINEISNGKRYTKDDLVRISCNGCKGCSYCCEAMGDTIILDPYDTYNLTKGLSSDFTALLGKYIELTVVDGLISPHILIREDSGACGFLSKEGRCNIHSFRPGFCRLFPLGRIYEDGSFTYFIQKDECPMPGKTKVKIKDWLGINDLEAYEKYVLCWHDLLKRMQTIIKDEGDEELAKNMSIVLLKVFFYAPYNREIDFYAQFYERVSYFLSSLGLE